MASHEDTRVMLGRAIRRWMVANVEKFIDECGEVNATAMVEAWDLACGQGGDTLDPDHVAWEVAAQVSEQEYKRRTGSPLHVRFS